MSTYKLYYFPVRGRGECARLIFAQANVPHEDNRIAFDKWPAFKPTTPFGQMPVLEVDGVKIGQSMTINRFLARKFGLAGKTPIEEALVDSIADLYRDFYTDVADYGRVASGMRPGNKTELYNEKVVPAVEKYGPFFEKMLKEAGHGYYVGKSVTWADLLVADGFRNLINWEPTIFDKFSALKEHIERIEQLPNIKKWIETRPKTNM